MNIERSLVGVLAAALMGAPASAQDLVVINDQAEFPEGPAVIGGTLYYTQYAGHVVTAWDGETNREIWRQEGCGPSAVAPLGDDLVVTCYDNGAIARISRAGDFIAAYDADRSGAPLVGPNDFTSDERGGLYFTTSGPWESAPIVGKVHHMTEAGAITTVADDLHYANGLAMGEDGRLYVNESEAGRVISLAVAADGSLSDRRHFARVGAIDPEAGADAYPDGLKRGPDGNFYIGLYSAGRITVVDPEGAFVKAIEVPSAAAPNLAFSPDGADIFVTAVDDTDDPPYPGAVYRAPAR